MKLETDVIVWFTAISMFALQPHPCVQANEASPVVSDEPDLEELGQIQVESIYSASKYEQKVTKAAASASIITREEIQRFGHRNVADALKSVRGMNVSNDRNYSYFGLRGFLRPGDYTTRVLVLINGHRMNENLFDSGTGGPDTFIDIDNVERIEIVRGPGSAIYGNNAFFGVINIVTRTGAQIDGTEISAEAGSYDTYKGRFTYGTALKNGVQLHLSGSALTSDGDDDLYYPEFGATAENSDEERARYLFGSISYHGITLEGNYHWRDKNVPTASFGTIFNDGREYTEDHRSYLELRYESAIDAETAINAKISYDQYDYDAVYPYDYGLAAPVLNKDVARGKWITPEVNVRRTFMDRLTAVVGADAHINLDQQFFNYDEDPYFLNSESDGLTHNYGVYAQTDLELYRDLNLVTGLRYDYFQDVGGELNPRIGLIYSPWKDTTFKLLYGEAFRAPNPYELLYQSSGGEALAPESIRTYEAVIDQYFLKNYRASLSVYRFEVDDIISQREDPGELLGYVFENNPGVVGNGIEAEFEARFDHGVLARASYGIQRAEDSVDREITNSPRHQAKAGLILPVVNDRLFSGFELQYTSSALTLSGNKADDFFLVNWTIYARELLPGLDLSLSVYNLFDENYGYPGAEDHLQEVIQQDGRTFRAKVTYSF